MADEIEWREGDEDGKQIAEVNGWTVRVNPTRGHRMGEWFYATVAECPTCGSKETMGGGYRQTMTAAQAEGIALARRWRPKCARGERTKGGP